MAPTLPRRRAPALRARCEVAVSAAPVPGACFATPARVDQRQVPAHAPVRERRHVVDRLSQHERHGQQWHLQVPCSGDDYAVARPLLLLLGLPTLGLALGISVITTFGPVV